MFSQMQKTYLRYNSDVSEGIAKRLINQSVTKSVKRVIYLT